MTPASNTWVRLSLDRARAVEIALGHEKRCECENCTTAHFAIEEILRSSKGLVPRVVAVRGGQA